MYVRTAQRLNWGGQESKKLFAVYDFDTPMTLQHCQGHQTWYELADPKKDYNDGKFEKPHLNSVHEKVNNKVFVKSENT